MASASSSDTRFRPEIAGLRAIAVLGVVIFHAGVSQLGGGYVGVDVFFVISGFLITNIIVNSLNRGTFTYADFYARRVKRLFPAAFALVVVVTVLGFFILYPAEYKLLAESAAASLAFVANIYFYFNTGYFDQSSDVMPLLHMWSLGVEEQFYLITPVILVGAYKLGRERGLLILLSAIFVASLAVCILTSAFDLSFAFFQIPARAWQFATGGLLVFMPHSRSRMIGNFLSVLGLVTIMIAMFMFDPQTPYPSAYALLPTLGAAGILYGTTAGSTYVGRLLSISPMVWVGKISYSVYLWHWPVVVYYRLYILERPFHPVETAVMVAVSIVLGWISWAVIEERWRHSRVPDIKALVAGVGGLVLCLAVPSVVLAYQGFPERIRVDTSPVSDLDKMWAYQCADTISVPGAGESCVVGVPWDNSKIKGILWGDSHSEHFAPVFADAAKKLGISIVVAPRGCPPFFNSDSVLTHEVGRDAMNDMCTVKQNITVEWLQKEKDVEIVIFATPWTHYAQAGELSAAGEDKAQPDQSIPLIKKSLLDLINRTASPNRRFLIMGDVPRPYFNLNGCVAASMTNLFRQSSCPYEFHYLSARNVALLQKPIMDALLQIATERDDVDAVPSWQRLCGDDRCPTFINDEFIYRDNNHYRRNLKPETLRQIAEKLGIPEVLASEVRAISQQ